MHPVEHLWARHHPPGASYPRGVVPVPAPIGGRAFFPGGHGLWSAKTGSPLPAFPIGGVMVLGHDFHSESGYAESHRLGGERATLPTWRNLIELLAAAGIDPDRCFFTNLFMGLRQGTATTGVFPGAGDARFVDHCLHFLAEQLRAQRPALVLTLGVHVPPLVARISPQLATWGDGRGLKHLDRTGPVRTDVTVRGVGGFTTTVVALIHPSLRHASLRHRQYGGRTGADAELAMLRDGLAASAVRSA